MTKDTLVAELQQNNYAAIVSAAAKSKRVLSLLLSLTFDADDLMGWRAVKALGLCSAQIAETDAEFVRNILRRLMWSLNDESGSIGWRAPQAMGAIIAQRPRQFAEFIPVVVSLFELDETHFYPGVLWAIGHIAQRDADSRFAAQVLPHVSDASAQARGMAARCLGQLRATESIPLLKPLLADEAPLTVFIHDQLHECTVSNLAQEALAQLERCRDEAH